jgi:hypothetical protein
VKYLITNFLTICILIVLGSSFGYSQQLTIGFNVGSNQSFTKITKGRHSLITNPLYMNYTKGLILKLTKKNSFLIEISKTRFGDNAIAKINKSKSVFISSNSFINFNIIYQKKINERFFGIIGLGYLINNINTIGGKAISNGTEYFTKKNYTRLNKNIYTYKVGIGINLFSIKKINFTMDVIYKSSFVKGWTRDYIFEEPTSNLYVAQTRLQNFTQIGATLTLYYKLKFKK